MLSVSQTDDFRRNGFIRVPGMLAEPELDQLRDEWARLWREIDAGNPSVQRRGHEAGGQTPDRIDPAHIHSPLLHELCLDKRLTGVASDALGSEAEFFKDKLISKLPGTHGYGLHQDWPYWEEYGAPADSMVTLMIAIDAANRENGALEIWPQKLVRLPPATDEPRDVHPGALDDRHGETIEMDAGDGLLVHSLAPHRSGTNRSAVPRRSYFITYVTADFSEAAARREREYSTSLRHPLY